MYLDTSIHEYRHTLLNEEPVLLYMVGDREGLFGCGDGGPFSGIHWHDRTEALKGPHLGPLDIYLITGAVTDV